MKDFKGRVAIVTGAGGGLGRTYAVDLAKLGCKIVVNDLGGAVTGDGKGDSRAADKVVNEIKAFGGEAVANYDSVVDGENIVKTAMDAYGRVDIVINNAGILRDVSFHKMKESDFNLLYDVHLNGTYAVTKAAYKVMRQQKYGRVLFVTSAAGIYGNFGQAHYSTVKMGVVGFCKAMAKEGAKRNIFCNTIAPIAGSRMTATVMPPEMVEALKPEYVSRIATYLVSEECEETGGLFEVGAGWAGKLRWERTKGAFFNYSNGFTPEHVRDSFERICDFSEPSYPNGTADAFGPIMEQVENGSKPLPAPVAPVASRKLIPGTLEDAIGFELPKFTYNYTNKDVILYALGIGASKDPLSKEDDGLQYTYESHKNFAVFPTFGVVVPAPLLTEAVNIPGPKFNPMMMLHGEQYLEIFKTIPTDGVLHNYGKVVEVLDKKKGALVHLEIISKDALGEPVLKNIYSLFVRGHGGYGGFSGKKEDPNNPPNRAPDCVNSEVTDINSNILYRLSGDANPLHIDPNMAAMGGFDRPILHGLCSFGHAARAVVKHFGNNDPATFKAIKVRFSASVYPGETLVTEMWKVSDTKIIFRASVAERKQVVLSNCYVELKSPADMNVLPKAPAGGWKGWQCEKIFYALSCVVDEELVDKVGGKFRYDIVKDHVTRSWAVDLSQGQGSVKECAQAEKADCIVVATDQIFMEIMTGKLNGQAAYTQQKIKIKGDILMSGKMSFIGKALRKFKPGDKPGARAAAAAAPKKSGGASFGAETIFAEMKKRITPELVKKVRASYRFDVKKGSVKKSWLVDMKSGSGSVGETASGTKADCIIMTTDDNFMKLMTGKLDGQTAFMQGKIKIKGNMMLASKLGLLAKPKAAM